MIFQFAVRHLRWLAKIPLVPQFFDAFLLANTAIFHRPALAAIEALETRVLEIPGLSPCVHRFGGVGFRYNGREIAHLHGNGLLDVVLVREAAESLVAAKRAEPHHVFGPSRWISFWVRSKQDVPQALDLIQSALALARRDESACE